MFRLTNQNSPHQSHLLEKHELHETVNNSEQLHITKILQQTIREETSCNNI